MVCTSCKVPLIIERFPKGKGSDENETKEDWIT